MKIRYKILYGFLILALMLIIAGVFSLIELNLMGKKVKEMLDNNYKSVVSANQMLDAIELEDSGILLLMLGNRNQGRTIAHTGDSIFLLAFGDAKTNITENGESEIIDSISEKYLFLKALWIRPIVGTSNEGNLTWYTDTVRCSINDLKQSIRNLGKLNDGKIYAISRKMQEQAERAMMPAIISIIAALVFSVLFNYFVNVFFINPIVTITNSVDSCVKFRTPYKTIINSKDELYTLNEAIKRLINGTT